MIYIMDLLSTVICLTISFCGAPPWGRRGFKSRIRPSYLQRVVKATKWDGVSESPYKKGGPVSVQDGLVKEPYEMSMALGAQP